MVLWIEAQNSLIIALLVSGICYAVAAAVFVVAALLSRQRIASDMKATTPVMLTPLSVITALLIAFLASHVWSNLDRASALVGQEASAIRETVVLADNLPSAVRDATRSGLKTYLRFVEAEDWPAMMKGGEGLQQQPPGLTDAVAALLSFAPNTGGQRVAQERAVIAVEQALAARRDRILLSEATIAPIQWGVILILDALVLFTISMVHVDRRATTAINLFIFSTAMAACLVLLAIYDRPFATGGNTVQPTALREVGLD